MFNIYSVSKIYLIWKKENRSILRIQNKKKLKKTVFFNLIFHFFQFLAENLKFFLEKNLKKFFFQVMIFDIFIFPFFFQKITRKKSEKIFFLILQNFSLKKSQNKFFSWNFLNKKKTKNANNLARNGEKSFEKCRKFRDKF